MSNKLPTPEDPYVGLNFFLISGTRREYYLRIKTLTGKIIDLYPNDLISFENPRATKNIQTSIIDKITPSLLQFYDKKILEFTPSDTKDTKGINIGGTAIVNDYDYNTYNSNLTLKFIKNDFRGSNTRNLPLLDTIEILGRKVNYEYKDTPNGGQRKKRRTVRKRKYKRSLRKMH